jgi:hypothetical protein
MGPGQFCQSELPLSLVRLIYAETLCPIHFALSLLEVCGRVGLRCVGMCGCDGVWVCVCVCGSRVCEYLAVWLAGPARLCWTPVWTPSGQSSAHCLPTK